MTVLVTGGAGYIGSHVVKELSKNGYDVVVIDNLSTGFKEAVTSGTLEVGDIGDSHFLGSIFKKYSPSSVMHFAGSIIVPESVKDPIKYYENNTKNSLMLIKLCLEYKVKHFIFSSTAATYGNLGDKKASEDMPTFPESPYGRSKLMTEWTLKDASYANKDFSFVALRYFNVCGASLEGEIGQSFPNATHLIKVASEAANGKREKVEIFGTDYDTPDGTCIRDYIHVVDLARAHIEALKFLEHHKRSEIFNCGYGVGLSVKEVIGEVKKYTGIDFKVVESKRREGDPAVIVCDNKKILQETNWKPMHQDLKTIVETAYNWERNKRYG